MMPVPDTNVTSASASASHNMLLSMKDKAIAVWLDWLVTVHRPRRIAAVQERRIRRARANAVISAGYRHSLALRSDGSVACWGSNNHRQAPPAGVEGDFVAVAAGDGHSLALRADGSVACWGSNYFDHAAASWARVHGALSSLWWRICCGNGSPSAQQN